ncbi:PKD domain-containing protein [Kribbella turkmenica]|uniref:PKD domain-containing protein n=1 Tax=Kribbella turkmenica TaxID=2530375 RepID=A0A4R4WZZ2_9ACTN|nr:ricin-type beta-trefoil lectin domain protein [Kribbella turkmenica]TDD23476.1 PKD domain-containing protein [Kribbella turkmenica]
MLYSVKRLLAVLCVLLLAPLLATGPAQAAVVPGGFSEQVVFTGLTNPTNVAFADDGRVFVAEKSGLIKVFDSLDDSTPGVFADLRTKVHNYWDRGLLGLALHPGFPADPRVYVLYTYDALVGGTAPKWGTVGGTSDPCPSPPGPTGDGCQVSARLSVLTPSGTAVAEQVLVEDWCQVFPSHSIGSIEFGPDGMLYAGGGDGASFNYADYGQDGLTSSDLTPDNPCGDPPSPTGTALTPPSAEGGALRAQDLRTSGDPTTLDGSIIRVHPDTGLAAPGNPLLSSPDLNARRIVAHGLRNPMRFDFRPGTSELWIGDVGWSASEEINRIVSPTAGVTNFGWPCYEGNARQGGYDGIDLNICENLYAAGPDAVASPYFAYKRSEQVVAGESCGTGSSSLSGMSFYEEGNYPPEYDGALFFADYSRKCIWAMLPGGNGLPSASELVTFASGNGTTRLQTGPGGDIFAVDYDNGRLLRYVYNGTNNPPTAIIDADPTSGPSPLTVTFDGTASDDADGHPLTYAWDLDGDGQYDDSTAATAQYTYSGSRVVTVRLRVTDGHGGVGTASTEIDVANGPPTATITAPTPATTWKVGDTISFAGTATDPEQGTLPGSALTWALIMHHCPSDCHAHQITTMTGATGTFTAPDHEYPSYLELRLTAKDSAGLTDVKSLRLDPKTVGLTFATSPSGLRLTYFSKAVTTPSTSTAIIGSNGSLSADLLQQSANNLYRFASWSDGGARTHNFVAPATPTTYTASYIPKRNLARNRPVAVSSVYTAGREGPKAVDGSMSTAWSSARSDPQWIRVDLGSITVVNRVLLNWLGSSYGKAYQVQVSTSGRTWKTVYATTTGDGLTDNLVFTPNYARYVRVTATARGLPGSYYSLWEFGVFQDTGHITGIAGKCVDIYKASSADGTPITLYTCHGNPNQQWTQFEDGTVRSLGKCLDARGTAIRTPAVLWTCDGSEGQKWLPRTNGTLLNVRSGQCLDATGASSANGTRLILYTCHTAINQRWTLP